MAFVCMRVPRRNRVALWQAHVNDRHLNPPRITCLRCSRPGRSSSCLKPGLHPSKEAHSSAARKQHIRPCYFHLTMPSARLLREAFDDLYLPPSLMSSLQLFAIEKACGSPAPRVFGNPGNAQVNGNINFFNIGGPPGVSSAATASGNAPVPLTVAPGTDGGVDQASANAQTSNLAAAILDPCAHKPESIASLYARVLAVRAQGYALWDPRPDADATAVHQLRGTTVGDVGWLTPHGQFVYLFNILSHKNDEINSGAPDCLRRFDLSTKSKIVQKPSTERNFIGCPNTQGDQRPPKLFSHRKPQFTFRIHGSPAGLCVLPTGSSVDEILNPQVLHEYILQNAEAWYRAYQGSIPNGALYLVTAATRAKDWANCALETKTRPGPEHIRFTGTTWTGQRSALCQMRDPQDPHRNLPNQTVIIKGYRMELVRSPAQRSVALSEVPGDYEVQPHNPRWVDMQTATPSSGGTPSRIVESLRTSSPGPSVPTQLSTSTPDSSTPSHRHDVHARFVRVEPADVNVKDNVSAGFPSQLLTKVADLNSEPFHPLDTLHDYLRQKFPAASLIVTHDDHWISTLKSNEEMLPDPEDLVARVLDRYKPVVQSGIVFMSSRQPSGQLSHREMLDQVSARLAFYSSMERAIDEKHPGQEALCDTPSPASSRCSTQVSTEAPTRQTSLGSEDFVC
ncbi:Git3 domain-containing protein [Mycena kentingensis (nom. inval.)]|nr:Git3 domain-containing protein [Mycena kentingensis (nom. inval.)]